MANFDTPAAIEPANLDAVPRLLSEIASSGHAFTNANNPSLGSRMDLLAKARALVCALETPREAMIRDCWAQPMKQMAIAFGIHSGLWSKMTENGDVPQNVADLASQLGIQEELLQRMMRHVAACGLLDVAGPDQYTPNIYTRAWAEEVIAAGYRVAPAVINPMIVAAPKWFKEHDYVVPHDPTNTIFQPANRTTLHFFEFLSSNPPHGQDFQNHMHGYFMGRPAWAEAGFYPAKERLIDGFDSEPKDSVLLVDIASGFGHYTEQFRALFPDTPGRLILQDLPRVIEQIQDIHPHIEKMSHDMFTEQPIKGARTYYTHFVLHDWPDDDCIKIARHIRDAMKPGYSRFLLHEHVVPPVGQDAEQTALDLLMMFDFAAKERSAAQWKDLLERKVGGLKIVGIYEFCNGVESVIECVRPVVEG